MEIDWIGDQQVLLCGDDGWVMECYGFSTVDGLVVDGSWIVGVQEQLTSKNDSNITAYYP